MTELDPKRVDRLFERALELVGDERAAYIDRECGDNDVLKREVVDLIAAAEASDDAIDDRFSRIRDRLLERVIGGSQEDDDASEDLSGQRVGLWRLERRIARGGLATVYLAQRDDGNYEQRAAFKVLRRGLDTDDLIARFRAERQILSALDHPSIAGILDGGALEDGRPYLVLEYVDGVPITQYCEDNKVSVRGRVRLMLEILRALHHAHRHLIVHRDIKPSNILVTGEGHVALLDFGIAKLLDPGALPGASTLTRTGMSLLTPGYCSPEQHSGAAVTTASDVYQAGAVLYQLLTGKRPRILTGDPGEADTPPPSRSLRQRPEHREVAGDLDAIVAKAMRVDPKERYASADEMEADLRRYLDGRPVAARPDTLRYRFVKFNRRRPWALPVGLAAALGLAAYIFTLTSYNEQLRMEQQRAAAAQAFLVDVLSSPDPFRPADPELGSDVTIVEALNLGVERLETELLEDPELRASVLVSIAEVYASLDRHEQAIALRNEALAIEENVYGEPSEPVLASLRMLVGEYLKVNDYEAAASYSREQLEFAVDLYPDGDPRIGAAEAVAADVASDIGNFEVSRELYERGIAKLRLAPDEYALPLINALKSLAWQLEFDEPETGFALLAEAGSLADSQFGPESLQAAQVRAVLASLYSATRQFERAEREFLATLPVLEEKLGRDHGETISAIAELGILYNRMELFDKAEPYYREALGRYRRKYGENHRRVADAYQNLATVLSRIGRYEQSIPMHEKAFEIYKAILPQDQPIVSYPLLSKAFAEVNDGRFESAEQTAHDAMDIIERTAPDSYLVGIAKCLIGRALEGREHARAPELMAEAQDILIGSVVSSTYRRFCRVPYE